MNRIYLRRGASRHYLGRFGTYFVVDVSFHGKPGRFDVLVSTSEDPVTIGRELPLSDCRRVIAAFEKKAEQAGYLGSREEALAIQGTP